MDNPQGKNDLQLIAAHLSVVTDQLERIEAHLAMVATATDNLADRFRGFPVVMECITRSLSDLSKGK